MVTIAIRLESPAIRQFIHNTIPTEGQKIKTTHNVVREATFLLVGFSHKGPVTQKAAYHKSWCRSRCSPIQGL